MTGIPIEALADIGDCQSVYQDMHDVIDNYDEPAGHPHWCIRMKAGFRTFGPGRAAGPRAIFQPRNVTCQVPAIDDEVRTANNGERIDVLRYEEERQNVEEAVHQRSQRPLRFLEGHPLALQQVIANRMGY